MSITLASNEPRISAKELGSPGDGEGAGASAEGFGIFGFGAEEPSYFHSAGCRTIFGYFWQFSMGFDSYDHRF